MDSLLISIGTPKMGETGVHIRYLQEILGSLGYFKGKSSAIYGKRTKESLALFQKDLGLISNLQDPNAGVF